MRQQYILAYDLGTTGNKAALFNEDLRMVSAAFSPYETYYPFANAIEQDPHEWWRSVRETTQQLLDKTRIDPLEIACLAFSGQMMGCVPVTRDAEPLGQAIIWADQRAAQQATRIERVIGLKRFYALTGHRPSASYSAAKILWIKENESGRFERTYKFLQAKDFIIARMTGAFVTDYSDASGTNLFEWDALSWSDQILQAADLSEGILPQPVESTRIVGYLLRTAADELGLVRGTPIVAGGGDGSCAAAGAGVVSERRGYHYLGSSAWIGVATRDPIIDDAMRTFNWIHVIPGMFAPTGTMQAAGASYQWLKGILYHFGLQNNDTYADMDALAATIPPASNGLIFLPYLLGERSPLWNPAASGAFVGLRIQHGPAHMIRAVMEGVALNMQSILSVFAAQVDLGPIVLIGGGGKSRVWAQILADVFEKDIIVPVVLDEATSMGAALSGGVGVGMFENFQVIDSAVEEHFRVVPREDESRIYRQLQRTFQNTYDALIGSFSDLHGYAGRDLS